MSESPEIAVIDATLEWPRYSKRFDELLGNDIRKYKAMKKEFPENPEAVVISGSTSGIYEDEEWIDELVARTRGYIQDDVPVLGLCFGHQVIAKALGASIEQMDNYEIGYKGIRMDEAEIFQGLSDVEYPFSTHQDRITDLPSELEVIAETDRCIQAIKHASKPVYGVQFHPELTPEIARKAVRTKDIKETRRRRLLREINEPNFERAKRTLQIFENFLDSIEEGNRSDVKGNTQRERLFGEV